MTEKHRRWPRRLLVVAIALVVAAGLVRLVADPLATRIVRRRLDALDDVVGRVAAVHVGFFPPSLTLRQLTFEDRDAHRPGQPLFTTRALRSVVQWRSLASGRAVAVQVMEAPKVSLFVPLSTEAIARAQREIADHGPRVLAALRRLPAFEVDRLTIEDGELLVVDTGTPGHPRVWLHQLAGEVRNLVNRPTGAAATRVAFRGRVQRSGTVTLRMTMDPAPERLTFRSRTDIQGVRLAELAAFVAPRTGVQPVAGTFSARIDLVAREGRLTGTMRPVVRGLEVEARDEGLGDRLQAWLTEEAFDLAADDREGVETLATEAPIRATLRDPRGASLVSVADLFRQMIATAVSRALPGDGDERAGRRPR